MSRFVVETIRPARIVVEAAALVQAGGCARFLDAAGGELVVIGLGDVKSVRDPSDAAIDDLGEGA